MSTKVRLLLCVCAALPSAVRAQDGENPFRPVVPLPGAAGESAEDKMRQLFRDVELELRRIDRLLADAGAGETRLERVPDSGIADLLRQSQERSESVIAGIDEILEIAAQQSRRNGPPSSSDQGNQSGQPQPRDGQGSPLDRPPQSASGESENTPQAEDQSSRPEDAQAGDLPKPRDGQGQPNSPLDSPSDPENRPNVPPPGSELGSPAVPSGDAEWGLLPPRAQEVFKTRGADDLPARYRDWIEGYYKRLNRVP